MLTPPPATPDPVAALRIATEALEAISGPQTTSMCRCCRQGDQPGDTHANCPCFIADRALTSIRKLAPPETMKGG